MRYTNLTGGLVEIINGDDEIVLAVPASCGNRPEVLYQEVAREGELDVGGYWLDLGTGRKTPVIRRLTPTAITNLPHPMPETLLIVPVEVAMALHQLGDTRYDVVYPHGPITTSDNWVEGYRCLALVC